MLLEQFGVNCYICSDDTIFLSYWPSLYGYCIGHGRLLTLLALATTTRNCALPIKNQFYNGVDTFIFKIGRPLFNSCYPCTSYWKPSTSLISESLDNFLFVWSICDLKTCSTWRFATWGTPLAVVFPYFWAQVWVGSSYFWAIAGVQCCVCALMSITLPTLVK
jgi:hypothetical protein